MKISLFLEIMFSIADVFQSRLIQTSNLRMALNKPNVSKGSENINCHISEIVHVTLETVSDISHAQKAA